MSEIRRVVDEIVPLLYEGVITDFRMPAGTNLAASNQCHVLTKELFEGLQHRRIQARREFHQLPDEMPWHFVIAHTPLDAEPTEDDIITDLNPWQFMNGKTPANYTYLHAPRGEVMERLQDEGAPEYIVALRGLSTIVHSHTEVMTPKSTQVLHK